MQHVKDWQFCTQPQFDQNSKVVTRSLQPHIVLNQGVCIYERSIFLEKYPHLFDQFKQDDRTTHDTYHTYVKQKAAAYVVYIPEGVTYPDCITLPTLWHAQVHVQHIDIVLAAHASVTVQHDLFGKSVHTIHCFLQRGAHLQFRQRNKQSVHAYNQVVTYQHAQSRFIFNGWYTNTIYNHIQLFLQQQEAQADVRIGAKCNFKGTNWLKSLQCHQAPNTRSFLLTKGMLHDQSHAVHLGMIEIDADAQQVQAEQKSTYLLMDEDAQADTVPSLKVKAHEVECAHGSAIGTFDQEHMYYLQARGLHASAAIELLEGAFFADVNYAQQTTSS